ncbi:DUF3106 domain-containing protein [Rhodanobacter sp. AS-Z3]|uniref:DUF3106 domain-containing protein n=1 Tax=Rhodanobacter sp. AS-Z3 TaxID=3031330 RepID=UPI0024791207|nr:DUF3106 domain-containing protein [Rhodanobacter sp. AS-Z3]WEN16362.1 DUF3106 domain-containing protein [Rhodanobacter sp. AS-Z3]
MNRILRPILPLLFAALLGGMTAPALHAQNAAPPPPRDQASAPHPWTSLDASQRDVLAPLKGEWDTMPPRKQARMLQRAEHWATLPPEKREAVTQHIAHWQEMTPAERKQARENMRKFHQMPAQQREQLHSTYDRFQKLPPAQRENLMRRWREMSPEQRKQWKEQRGQNRPSTAGHPV